MIYINKWSVGYLVPHDSICIEEEDDFLFVNNDHRSICDNFFIVNSRIHDSSLDIMFCRVVRFILGHWRILYGFDSGFISDSF